MIAHLAKIISQAKSQTVKVGFLSKSTYTYKNGMTTPHVAAIQEFGYPAGGIPPRPFFRQMVTKNKAGWPVLVAQEILRNKYDVERTLRRVGKVIEGQLVESINELWEPPLKPATIARKGFDKPLIHSSHMKNSVDSEIV